MALTGAKKNSCGHNPPTAATCGVGGSDQADMRALHEREMVPVEDIAKLK